MAKQQQKHRGLFYKYVHGGQALGELEDGKKALVWGVLPGETASFYALKSRSGYVEGVAEEIANPSADRVLPRDRNYMSTSPWQIVDETKEDGYKLSILREVYERAGAGNLPEIAFDPTLEFWHYRNKMEYSFYGDDAGLHLALHARGSHRKEIVQNSSIARPEIDEVAQNICKVLYEHSIRGTDLKTLMLRCNQAGDVVAALFVKDIDFQKIEALEGLCRGIIVVYSNPKSPASVRTSDLYHFGDISLEDSVGSRLIRYDVFSFFQVNVAVFNKVLNRMKSFVGSATVTDFYCGVGAIGLAFENVGLLVDSDQTNIEWALRNAGTIPEERVVCAQSENVVDFIDDNSEVLIVDPPRAGLHRRVVDKILETRPAKIVYLSCNPSTQARDVALLQPEYEIVCIEGYNFFPRTPHIECLVHLVRK